MSFQDSSISFSAEIIEHERLTPQIFKITLRPLERCIEPRPGQFFMLSVSDSYDPFLKRPFSIYDFEEGNLQFLYRVRGRGTAILSQKRPGQILSLTGPFGRSYPEPDKKRGILIIAGGLGIASLNYLIKRLINSSQSPVILYGARLERELSLLNTFFQREGLRIFISTEDGSFGKSRTIVDLFKEFLDTEVTLPSLIYACGPQAVLMIVDKVSQKMGLEAYLSVEERMACGIGVCLGCVIHTKEGKKRVCKEGPIFKEGEILW